MNKLYLLQSIKSNRFNDFDNNWRLYFNWPIISSQVTIAIYIKNKADVAGITRRGEDLGIGGDIDVFSIDIRSRYMD